MRTLILSMAVMVLGTVPSYAQDEFTVNTVNLQDQKAVFATVESVNVIAARARINGTIADLNIDKGDMVKPGQVIAKVGDEKLAIQISSMDSRIASLKSQLDKAKTDLDRAKSLYASGVFSKAHLDDAQTQYNVAASAYKSGGADRDVIRHQVGEGDVLAPVAGRILSVPVTRGAVIMPGEAVAMIAEENYVLRLQVPERHARYMKKDDPVRLDDGKTGKIAVIYPKIENGRVMADATVDGLGDYFVGERVRVWVSGGNRKTFVIPSAYVSTQFGIDRVILKNSDGMKMSVPIQIGLPATSPGVTGGIEILSGLRDGDILVMP